MRALACLQGARKPDRVTKGSDLLARRGNLERDEVAAQRDARIDTIDDRDCREALRQAGRDQTRLIAGEEKPGDHMTRRQPSANLRDSRAVAKRITDDENDRGETGRRVIGVMSDVDRVADSDTTASRGR